MRDQVKSGTRVNNTQTTPRAKKSRTAFYRCSLKANQPDFAELFAESNLLCIFVSANVLDKVHKTYPIRIIAGFLGLFQSLVQCVCQNTREPRSFCVHT